MMNQIDVRACVCEQSNYVNFFLEKTKTKRRKKFFPLNLQSLVVVFFIHKINIDPKNLGPTKNKRL